MSQVFAWPNGWPLLLLVPLAWLVLRGRERSRARRLLRVVGHRAPALAANLGAGERRARRVLFCAGLFFALLAVMQPAWGVQARKMEKRGVDLILCLDVSRSMLARDVAPSRLERAKQEIRSLSERVRGDRLGLVVFAGEARLAVPLTQDMESFADLVDVADPLSVGRGGTDLGAALETALAALEGQTGAHEAVLLITDGEDLEQRGLSVARTCAEEHITVHCVGFGSTLGSKIAVDEGSGEAFLRDRSGEEVVSAMNAAGLRRIAEVTGGGFANASASPRPLLELYRSDVLPMAGKSLATDERQERRKYFQWPLLAAFLLWVMELCLTDRRRRTAAAAGH